MLHMFTHSALFQFSGKSDVNSSSENVGMPRRFWQQQQLELVFPPFGTVQFGLL